MTSDLEIEESAVSAEIKQKLTVERGWFSSAADFVRNITYDDIAVCLKAVGVAAAAFGFFILIGYNKGRKDVLEASGNAKPKSAVEFSVQQDYKAYIQKASAATGVDTNVLESLLYAAKANPAYVTSARASGRRGVIPLDPAAVGVKGELLDSDPALCIEAAAEHYASLREKSGSDLEAVAGVVAGWDECQAAIEKASGRWRQDIKIRGIIPENLDFTVHLPGNAPEAAASARDYLNK